MIIDLPGETMITLLRFLITITKIAIEIHLQKINSKSSRNLSRWIRFRNRYIDARNRRAGVVNPPVPVILLYAGKPPSPYSKYPPG